MHHYACVFIPCERLRFPDFQIHVLTHTRPSHARICWSASCTRWYNHGEKIYLESIENTVGLDLHPSLAHDGGTLVASLGDGTAEERAEKQGNFRGNQSEIRSIAGY